MRKCTDRHTIPSSNAWVPATAGLICGGEVVKDLVNLAHTMRIDLNEDPDNEYAREAHERAETMRAEQKRIREERRKSIANAANDN